MTTAQETMREFARRHVCAVCGGQAVVSRRSGQREYEVLCYRHNEHEGFVKRPTLRDYANQRAAKQAEMMARIKEERT